ncbi:Maf family nucleotide pyrophosphatase [Luteirhabdus pelagi]|uniref:Maf family nucleotide pyrophosphatase n=1 Tax=Luteirhabdus pelagi TaxID=2792783 RepID=UPI00193986F9|nr:Maf family nucleotide pyrophosphatase [Luteirhabdus pelagi]
MIYDLLQDYTLILASGSPRRQRFFEELGLKVTIDVRPIDETYPSHLKAAEITDHLAEMKAAAFTDLAENDILITSDTIVWKEGRALEKASDVDEAKQMLRDISGQKHEVITSVCFTGKDFQKTVHEITTVWFANLSETEIDHYVSNFQPFDKAGSYGIQEWIGLIGVEKIEGSFFNVVGLPTRLVYKTLLEIAER